MMKAAVFLVVLALLVPFCLAVCNPSLLPTASSADESAAGTVTCVNVDNSEVYHCDDANACDGHGACLTCSHPGGFIWVNIQGTACCDAFYTVGALIWGDPHFTGFDGNKFDFQGLPNKWFNLLSAEDIQLNGFFQHSCDKTATTFVTQIGLQAGGSQIFLSPNNSTLDGVVVNHPHTEHKLKNGGVLRLPWNKNIFFEVETRHFLLSMHRIAADKTGLNCIQGSFDLTFQLKDFTGSVHGVIGQTAHHTGNAPEVEGKVEDYVVSGPFATDNKFNRYDL